MQMTDKPEIRGTIILQPEGCGVKFVHSPITLGGQRAVVNIRSTPCRFSIRFSTKFPWVPMPWSGCVPKVLLQLPGETQSWGCWRAWCPFLPWGLKWLRCPGEMGVGNLLTKKVCFFNKYILFQPTGSIASCSKCDSEKPQLTPYSIQTFCSCPKVTSC